MDRSITAAGVLLGMAIGFVTGVAFAVAKRAWSDHTKTKALIPGLKTAAWTSTRTSAGRFTIAGILVVAAIAWAFIGR
ncbi:MAG TPA: hypothetical protein VFC00_05295 [Micromonosporaceae bacterium]|nr:hypothetical protein [Micromonosporaceae bacterium]